jgi:hypothetical protein
MPKSISPRVLFNLFKLPSYLYFKIYSSIRFLLQKSQLLTTNYYLFLILSLQLVWAAYLESYIYLAIR